MGDFILCDKMFIDESDKKKKTTKKSIFQKESECPKFKAIYKKTTKKSKPIVSRKDAIKCAKDAVSKMATASFRSNKLPKYKIFNDIMLSYGGYCGSVISEQIGIAFGFKKMQRETAEVEIKVKKGEIVIRRLK